MERFKEQAFGFNMLGMAGGCLAVFIIIHIKGAAYVYEDIQWILWLETLWAGGSFFWALERLIKDLKE